ncbi:MAG TPA: hypothetical protein VG755_25915 [Nannocystaceae bacterium]|nr:hypothetical protein [Nannocystaceae bacterium]
MRAPLAASLVILALATACAEADEGPGAPPYDFLSEWGFFEGPLAELKPKDDVLPYVVASPLWADYAGKGRYLKLPEGGKIGFQLQEDWDFPQDTIFIKTFFFDTDRTTPSIEVDDDAQIVETRLLVNEAEGWKSYIYLWDEAQTEAERIKAGADVELALVDANGQPATQLYLVPDQNTCEDCHARDDVARVLGPFTHQLNTAGEDGANQIDHWAELELFESAPPAAAELPAFPNPAGDADLNDRARAYLHGNCAHCHQPGGGGGTSGLSFLAWEELPAEYGVCKVPAAAGAGAGGRQVDIWPGHPELSIVPFRMASVDPDIKMPELPSLLADDFGVELITAWISEMPEPECG